MAKANKGRKQFLHSGTQILLLVSVLSEAYQTEPGGLWAMTAWMGWDSPYPAEVTVSVCAFFLTRSLKTIVNLWLGFVKLLKAEKR